MNFWRYIKFHKRLNLNKFRSSDRLILILDMLLTVVMTLLKFFDRRNLDMCNHKPVVIRIGEINRKITGILLLCFLKEVIILGCLEFKLNLHVVLEALTSNSIINTQASNSNIYQYIIFSMNSRNYYLWSSFAKTHSIRGRFSNGCIAITFFVFR